MIKYIISLKNDICDEHSTFFFFIMVRLSPNHSHERPNQSLASIHWLTYKPTVFGAVVLCRLWWVCVWCIVGAHSLCSRQHVAYSL